MLTCAVPISFSLFLFLSLFVDLPVWGGSLCRTLPPGLHYKKVTFVTFPFFTLSRLTVASGHHWPPHFFLPHTPPFFSLFLLFYLPTSKSYIFQSFKLWHLQLRAVGACPPTRNGGDFCSYCPPFAHSHSLHCT